MLQHEYHAMLTMDKFKTVATHWDCDCLTNYIHLKNDSKSCVKCGAVASCNPDSREDEVNNPSLFFVEA